MKFSHHVTGALISATFAFPAASQTLSPEQKHLREIYQELVEINTTNSVGSCTAASQAMAARLKMGGFNDADMQVVVPPGNAKKGNLVARLKAANATKKPLLLLAHIDVVEAKREDWIRDPFKLIEENGQFYARGSSDDKAMAAVFVANIIRYKREKLAANRDIILALTCDEELVPADFNGVEYLLKNHRDLIDAELVLNEGGGGSMDKNGKYLSNGIQAGEKIFQNFVLEVTNPGGHSSRPVKENAIVRLSEGLARLGKFDFPFTLSDTTRAYYERRAALESPERAADMRAILRNPPDQAAIARLSATSPGDNATFRTTCVPTLLEGGHANNALPQRARATINCRILPGEPIASVEKTLARILADDQIKISRLGIGIAAPPPPLTPSLMQAVEETTQEMWPGVPVIPTLSVGGTDGRFLNNVGIWTYGISGMFHRPEGSNAHGLNEHIAVKSLYEGHDFLYRLAKRLVLN